MKRVIFTNNAPAPIGPYSQAIENNGMLFISGQVPIDPATGKIVEGSIAEQTRQVMENIRAIVNAANFGNDLSKILKCTIYLSDMSLFGAMNEVYGTAIGCFGGNRSSGDEVDGSVSGEFFLESG